MIAVKRRRKLKCSFCGKSDKEVTRLIGGPGVYICDACVGACNRILEATPVDFRGWHAMRDDQLLSALKIAEATVDATRVVLQAQIDELKADKAKRETAAQGTFTPLGAEAGGASRRLADQVLSIPDNVTDAMVAAWDPGIVDDLRRRASPYVQKMWEEDRKKAMEKK